MMKLLIITIITCILAGCAAVNGYDSKPHGGYGYYQSTEMANSSAPNSPQ